MVRPREMKLSALLRGLNRLGLVIDKTPANHMKAKNPKTNLVTMIPRHKPVKKSIVRSIFKWLEDQGFTDDEIKKALKLK